MWGHVTSGSQKTVGSVLYTILKPAHPTPMPFLHGFLSFELHFALWHMRLELYCDSLSHTWTRPLLREDGLISIWKLQSRCHKDPWLLGHHSLSPSPSSGKAWACLLIYIMRSSLHFHFKFYAVGFSLMCLTLYFHFISPAVKTLGSYNISMLIYLLIYNRNTFKF